MADVFNSTPVKTMVDGDVVVGFDSSNNTIKIDATTNTVTIDNTAGSNEVDVTKLGGTVLPVAGKVPIDGVNSTDVPTDLKKIGGVAVPVAGKVPIDGVNSTDVPVNITKVGGTTNPGTAGRLAIDGANSTTLDVNVVATSGTVQHFRGSASAVAANGGTATIAATDITVATTGKLLKTTVSSSVTFKADVQKDLGGTPTTVATLWSQPGGGTVHIDFVEEAVNQAGGTGNNFQVFVTNADKNDAADIYANMTWAEE